MCLCGWAQRDVAYVNLLVSHEIAPDRLRVILLGAIRYGKPLVLDMMDVDLSKEMVYAPRWLPLPVGWVFIIHPL